MAELLTDYSAPPGLANPHSQSILASTAVRKRIVSRRARGLLHGASAVDLKLTGNVCLRTLYTGVAGDSRGLVVFIHGWEGSADSLYVLSAAQQLHRHGFEVVRLNLRDHGGTHHLNEGLFHSCRIDEVVAAVRCLVERYPARRTFLAGFSLGGNFAMRVAARAPDAGIPLDRVIAVCPVLNPANTMQALESGPWIYRFYFLTKWRRSLRAKAQAFPELYDFGDLRRLPTLTATTDYFVEHYTNFPNLRAYLDGYAITGDALAPLDVPCQMILAQDDPVIPVADVVDLSRSPALDIKITKHGGHCGFLTGLNLSSWIDQQIAQQVGIS